MGLFFNKEEDEKVFFQSNQFDSSKKMHNLMTNPAAAGDAAHLLLHGITFGGIMHDLNRSANWSNLSQNVYNQACSSPNLRGFMAKNGEQVVVAGYNYLSVYQNGEYQKKVIQYSDIMKISLIRSELRVVTTSQNGKYAFVSLMEMREGQENLLNTILFFMKKKEQRNNNRSQKW